MADSYDDAETLKKMMRTDSYREAQIRALAKALVAAKQADEDAAKLAKAKGHVH